MARRDIASEASHQFVDQPPGLSSSRGRVGMSDPTLPPESEAVQSASEESGAECARLENNRPSSYPSRPCESDEAQSGSDPLTTSDRVRTIRLAHQLNS